MGKNKHGHGGQVTPFPNATSTIITRPIADGLTTNGIDPSRMSGMVFTPPSDKPVDPMDELRELEEKLASKRRLLGLGEGEKPVIKIAPPEVTLKIDLGCGKTHESHASPVQGCKICEGFDGADIADVKGIKYPKTNLWQFPWPWADDSVDELWCSHFVEHIPMCYWNPDGTYTAVPTHLESQDLFFKFFDECFRILKHDAPFTVIVPALQSTRSFQDPTHRRFLPPEAFIYLNRDWRKMNSLDHYNVKSHFVVNVNHTTPKDETLYHAEASARRYRHYWNVCFDHHAFLKSIKKEPAPAK